MLCSPARHPSIHAREPTKLGGTNVSRLATELVVIVAGVLVALWAEAARQTRQDRAVETATLLRIRDDVRSDSTYLKQVDLWFAQIAPSVRLVPDLLADSRPMTSSDLAATHTAALLYVLDRPFATWDDLLAAGGTGIVSDSGVRGPINAYYTAFLDLSEWKESFGMEYRDALLGRLPVAYTRQVLERCVWDPAMGGRATVNPAGFQAILDCGVEPDGGAAWWGEQLRAIPGLPERARLRDYGLQMVSDAFRRVVEAREAALAALERGLEGR